MFTIFAFLLFGKIWHAREATTNNLLVQDFPAMGKPATVKPVLSGPVLNGHPLLSGQL